MIMLFLLSEVAVHDVILRCFIVIVLCQVVQNVASLTFDKVDLIEILLNFSNVPSPNHQVPLRMFLFFAYSISH